MRGQVEHLQEAPDRGDGQGPAGGPQAPFRLHRAEELVRLLAQVDADDHDHGDQRDGWSDRHRIGKHAVRRDLVPEPDRRRQGEHVGPGAEQRPPLIDARRRRALAGLLAAHPFGEEDHGQDGGAKTDGRADVGPVPQVMFVHRLDGVEVDPEGDQAAGQGDAQRHHQVAGRSVRRLVGGLAGVGGGHGEHPWLRLKSRKHDIRRQNVSSDHYIMSRTLDRRANPVPKVLRELQALALIVRAALAVGV